MPHQEWPIAIAKVGRRHETCLIDSVRSSFHTYHCTTFGIWLDTASATSAAPIGWLIGIYQCPSYTLTFFVVFAHADVH